MLLITALLVTNVAALAPPLYWGRVHHNAPVDRDPRSGSYLSFTEYPGFNFPDFVTGNTYILSRDVVELLVGMAVSVGSSRRTAHETHKNRKDRSVQCWALMQAR